MGFLGQPVSGPSALNDIKVWLGDIKFGFGVMNEFSDMSGSAVVAKPGEMSAAAAACKGQCQFNLHPLAPQPSVDVQGIFLQISSLNTKRRLILDSEILQSSAFSSRGGSSRAR